MMSGSGKIRTMIIEAIPAINELTASEKWILMSELWDSMATQQDGILVSDDHKLILDQCLVDHACDSSSGASWTEARSRIVGSA